MCWETFNTYERPISEAIKGSYCTIVRPEHPATMQNGFLLLCTEVAMKHQDIERHFSTASQQKYHQSR